MKITNEQLKQIIKEELNSFLGEAEVDVSKDPADGLSEEEIDALIAALPREPAIVRAEKAYKMAGPDGQNIQHQDQMRELVRASQGLTQYLLSVLLSAYPPDPQKAKKHKDFVRKLQSMHGVKMDLEYAIYKGKDGISDFYKRSIPQDTHGLMEIESVLKIIANLYRAAMLSKGGNRLRS